MTKIGRRIGFGLAVGLGALATGFQFQRWFTEQPEYDVLRTIGELEVRRYGSRVVATTRMAPGEGKDEGFRILAGYIFGGNRGGERIDMTSPVETDAASGERIAMTSPVETESVEGERVMRFVMPSEYTLEELPEPTDPRIELNERDGEVVAALRFSGRPSEAEFEREIERATQLVRERGLEMVGSPRVAQYDPPWTIAPFRRNEILVPISAP